MTSPGIVRATGRRIPARTGVRHSTLNWFGDVSLISRYAGRASCARAVGTASKLASRKMVMSQARLGVVEELGRTAEHSHLGCGAGRHPACQYLCVASNLTGKMPVGPTGWKPVPLRDRRLFNRARWLLKPLIALHLR